MKAGKLDRLVIISTPISESDVGENAGETTTTYEYLATVWAEVRQPSAMETVRNGATTAQATYAIRIRWRDDVTAGCRLTYVGRDIHEISQRRTLEISQVIEGHKRRTELQLIAHEVRA